PADPTLAADAPTTDPSDVDAEPSTGRPADDSATAADNGLADADRDDERAREHGAVVRSESA
ncbi:MAG: hypothetical protein WA890_28820, partial [Micromonospora sp.]